MAQLSCARFLMTLSPANLPHRTRSPNPLRFLGTSPTRSDVQAGPSQSKSEVSSSKTTSDSDENRSGGPPPYLPRPLGVDKRPSTAPLTKEEKLAKLVDDQARLEERRHLISQVSKGYYHDWNTLRHNGNKLWTAPPSLIQESRALYFPNISGIALANKAVTHTTDLFEDKISIVAVESTRMSEEHTRSYYGQLASIIGQESNLQLIRLNVQENPLKSWLVNLFMHNLRKAVPSEQHARYLLSNQNLEYIREPLGMVNKLLGYIYLVDWHKKVRWAGCGLANVDELKGLSKSTQVLLKRFKEKS